MKNTKAIIGILLIFVLGIACGALLMHMSCESRMNAFVSGKPGMREEVLLKRLSQKLDLDEQQRVAVREIIRGTQAEMKQIRQQFKPQIMQTLEKSRAEVRKILRPDQQKKYDQYLAERKARWAERGEKPFPGKHPE
jgi:Spy/CpxP family protein refolding chaperone